ncbi:MAG: hypothetical protein QM719_03250 [Thermomonas sp.]
MTEPESAAQPAAARHSAMRKGLRWFLAEFLVVVVGILVAMALNSWYQDRQDALSERDYLQRLSRDLQGTMDSLQEARAFEQKQFDDGIFASRALAASTHPADREAVATALSHLAERRTLLLRNTTYVDMLNTGNLRLVRDTKLRDRIAGFYQDTEFKFQVINKNNTSLVDDAYRQRVLVSGLVMPRIGSNLASRAAGDAETKRLLGDAKLPPDRIWTLSPDAPEWAVLQGNLRMRVVIASATKDLLAQCIGEAQRLKAEVDARLDR